MCIDKGGKWLCMEYGMSKSRHQNDNICVWDGGGGNPIN